MAGYCEYYLNTIAIHRVGIEGEEETALCNNTPSTGAQNILIIIISISSPFTSRGIEMFVIK